MLLLYKKVFPFAFCIRTLQRFLWTLLILTTCSATVLFAALSLLGLATVGTVFAAIFFAVFLYGALGIVFSILYFFEIVE